MLTTKKCIFYYLINHNTKKFNFFFVTYLSYRFPHFDLLKLSFGK